jgi:hypothetical protein
LSSGHQIAPSTIYPGAAFVEQSATDGADGGQHAPRMGNAKSRRWRDGDSRSDKPSGAAARSPPVPQIQSGQTSVSTENSGGVETWVRKQKRARWRVVA